MDIGRTLLMCGGLIASACAGQAICAAEPTPAAYQPAGQMSWDYWFAKQGDTYYAFYLQARIGDPNAGENTTVGMASSKDLLNWTECGTVLSAAPSGHWNDKFIATGSVWKSGREWLMLFTGHTYTGVHGMGLAKSADLKSWTRVGDGPVKLDYKPFVIPEGAYWQSKGLKAGEKHTYTVLADPYVLPTAIDGWSYMIGNAVIDDLPLEKRGAICLMRTKDGLGWEDCGIISLPMRWERMETPQVWKHGNRWYLYFGAVFNDTGRANYIYTADKLQGPFEHTDNSGITLPDNRDFYIAKVMTGPDGKDYLLCTVHPEYALSRPYEVVYNADGSISLLATNGPVSAK